MEKLTAPWVANPKEQFYNGSNNTFEINHGNDGECVAEVVHGFDNAKLMAAAPELLEACQAFIELFRESDMRPEDESYELADKIQSAINKAIGEVTNA